MEQPRRNLIVDPGIELAIEIRSVTRQRDFQEVKWRRLFALEFAHGNAGDVMDFECANDATWILTGAIECYRVNCLELGCDDRQSFVIDPGRYAVAKAPVGRNFRDPPALDNRVHVEGRSPHEYGELAAIGDVSDGLVRQLLDLGDGDVFLRLEDIDQVMANPTALVMRWFSDTYVEVAVEITGIDIDHFAVKREREIDRAGRLSDPGRSEYRDYRWEAGG